MLNIQRMKERAAQRNSKDQILTQRNLVSSNQSDATALSPFDQHSKLQFATTHREMGSRGHSPIKAFNPNQKSKLEAIDESRMSYVTACKSQKSCATQTKPQRARSGSRRKDYVQLAKSLKKMHLRKSSNLSGYSKKSSRSAFKAKHEVSEP